MLAHTLLRQRSDLGGLVLRLTVLVFWWTLGWRGTADDGDLVDFQVYTLCRVDQSIHIAMSADMDIPMTYASLD
jgi:hypothetical protein